MSLSDDYVISLLQKDAQATGTSIRNANRLRANAPKPNTRFLQNVIRDTNSHNAALKAKEAAESRQRLKQLRNGGNDRASERDQRKRAREGNDTEEDEARRKRKSTERPDRWAQALGGLDSTSDMRERRKDRKEELRSRPRETQRDRSENEDRRTRRSSIERQYSRDRHPRHHRKPDRSRERSHSPQQHVKQERERSDRRRSPVAGTRAHREGHHQQISTRESHSSESDPLEDLIGPKPAPKIRPRGRGASRTFAMDSRFREDYDPRTDVSMEPIGDDNDDWDMALEALRDRMKWKQKCAERLRSAGFTEGEIAMASKTKKLVRPSDGEKDVEDVQWSTKGEARAWDRGKVLDEQGSVEVKAAWTK
ncbi:Hypothetical protein R9X50_00447000 [Acrodontium crateriforme]|uniref:Pre-mRNA-splicing factor 38B n=1 Tax=Acrodontium crateriforme TaxID=150365 RepID=A0AAQ3RA76_9PEZI|nr:Hypothetical protein R9X50_00447000 [Acrodontium crateriforme]